MNEMGWVKCSDRMPVLEGHWRKSVLVYGSPQCGTHSEDWQVMEAYVRKNGDEIYFEFGEYDCPIEVTHWMPLPEVPKGE